MKLLGFLLSLTLLSLSALAFSAPSANALSGSDWQAGRIIDDAVFFNPNTMDPASIQGFLNSKVPSCDTYGAQAYGGTTRSAYGASKGYPAPYTCLRNYSQDTPSKVAEAGLCEQYIGGTKSSAQIIYDVSLSCGINPKVLIILLEKEQSLITDDWPWSIQYRSATGYGCPDTAPCDSEYYGFFNQVYNAARQFKRYQRDSSLFSYRSSRINYIQYNPNAACGGANVYVQNQATAGLYNYTPYQPNPSALANLYGTGDGCGAYGNRNFWRLFNDWFGSTTAPNCTYPTYSPNAVYRLYNKGTGNHLLTSSSTEVCIATSIGYLFDGLIMNSEQSNGVPVFRLESRGRYLFTSSVSERDAAVSQFGYRLEGVGFNGVNPSSNPTEARPVYRLINFNGTYNYTISSYERDAMIKYGYRYEGVAFYIKENPGATISPTFRLSHPNGIYLFTQHVFERDAATQFYGYRYEGVGFNTITRLNEITVPIYRLAGRTGYLYTTSLLERVYATHIGYRDEGIAMFTYGANDPGLTPVFRLSSSTGTYLYTSSANERDLAASQYGYRIEGVGFRTAP